MRFLPFPREDKNETPKIIFKNLFFQNHSCNFNQKHSSSKRIQVCSNEGPLVFPRGNYNETAKMHWQHFKNLFSRTTGAISTKLGAMCLFVKETKIFTNNQLFNSLRRHNDLFLLMFHCIVQMCLLIGTVS